ncbi:unnamed protein product [Camellia sinensis]
MIWYAVTTAENGQRALELLGLGDRQHIINNKKKNKKKLRFQNHIPILSKTYPLQDSKVNLIITDYCMPGMAGYELLKKLKESSDLKEIPVVIVSSENVPTRIKKCMKGAQEFMLKPLQQSDIKKLRCHMTKFSKPTNGKLCMGS